MNDNNSPTKIGGKGVLTQVDETAICKERIIIDFSIKNDNTTNIQWLIGGVIQDSSKEFFLCLVKNRPDIIKVVLEKYILQGSTIISDGHLFYPKADRNLNFTYCCKSY